MSAAQALEVNHGGLYISSLDEAKPKRLWPVAQEFLWQAVSRCKETARDKHELVRFGLRR